MDAQTGRLAGKVAIIAGASTGTGPVMAQLFVRRVLLAARPEDLVQDAAREAGDGAIAIRADVTSEVDVRAMVDRALASIPSFAACGLSATASCRRLRC